MIQILICDPHPDYPEFDFQWWTHLGWKSFAIPGGRWLGEWAWVGRVPSTRGAA